MDRSEPPREWDIIPNPCFIVHQQYPDNHDSKIPSAPRCDFAHWRLFHQPYSRAAESEADRIGIEIAARAGYDPNAAASLWRKMEQVSKDSPPELLNTHPSAANRQRTLAELAPKMMKYYHPDELHPVYPLD